MSIFMDAESRTNPAIAATAQARKDQTYTIELKIYDDPDDGHRVLLHSEKLDALPVFQIFAEMLPRIMRNLTPEEAAQAREILAEALTELMPARAGAEVS